MLADFQNSFTVVFFKKLATEIVSHSPPHLRRIAPLPCNHFRLQLLQTTPKNQYCAFLM